jgi:hypothetical protein
MPSEYLHTWLIPCKDQRGHPVNLGIGVSEDNKIVLFGPPGEKLSLGPDEANAYILLLIRVLKIVRQST